MARWFPQGTDGSRWRIPCDRRHLRWHRVRARFDPAGGHLFSASFPEARRIFGKPGNDGTFAFVSDRAVRIGDVEPEVDPDFIDVSMVGKLSSSGELLWHQVLGSPSGVHPEQLVVADDDSVLLAGTYDEPGTVGAPLPEPIHTALFVVRYNDSGRVDWLLTSGTYAWGVDVFALSSNPNGDFIIAGTFDGAFDLGGGELDADGDFEHYSDGYQFLARFDRCGNHLWSRSFQGPSSAFGVGLANAPDGNTIFAGRYDYRTQLEGENPAHEGGFGGLFLARLGP